MILPSPILVLDVETYGIAEKDASGRPLPDQRFFHPERSVRQDGVPSERLVQTVSLTVPRANGRLDTMVFFTHNPEHVAALVKWIDTAGTIMTFNGLYDLLYTMRGLPRVGQALSRFLHRGGLWVDVSVLNSYDNEARAFFSLKQLAVTLGVAEEEWTPPARFKSILDPDAALYNARDTHVTFLCGVRLLRNLRASRWPDDEAGMEVLRWWSDLLYVCLRMGRYGLAYSGPALKDLHDRASRRVRKIEKILGKRGVLLAGPGSVLSKRTLVSSALDLAKDGEHFDAALLKLTDKKGEVSWSTQNRLLVLANLPPSSRPARLLRLVEDHAEWAQIIKHYTKPLLSRDGKAAVIPQNYKVALAFPTWYPTRAPTKDEMGSVGGTLQGRLAAKEPAVQTDPPLIQAAHRSRFDGGWIVKGDLSQNEMRTAGLLSGDPVLIRAYMEDRDLHTDLAVEVEGAEVLANPHFNTGDKRLDPRQWYKQSNFLMLYRGGAAQLQLTLLKLTGRVFPYEYCQRIVEGTRRRYSRLMEWHDELVAEVVRTGGLLLPITYHYRSFDPRALPEIANFPVQTTAANLTSALARYVNVRLPPIPIYSVPSVIPVNLIHDALVYDARTEADARRVKALMEEALEHERTRGYWARLERITGRHVPIAMKIQMYQEH